MRAILKKKIETNTVSIFGLSIPTNFTMTVVTRSQTKEREERKLREREERKERKLREQQERKQREREERKQQNAIYVASLENWYIATINQYIESSLEFIKNQTWYKTQMRQHVHNPQLVSQYKVLFRGAHFDNIRVFDEMFHHITHYLPTVVTGVRMRKNPSHPREVYDKILECCQIINNPSSTELYPITETEHKIVQSIKHTLAVSKNVVGKLLVL